MDSKATASERTSLGPTVVAMAIFSPSATRPAATASAASGAVNRRAESAAPPSTIKAPAVSTRMAASGVRGPAKRHVKINQLPGSSGSLTQISDGPASRTIRTSGEFNEAWRSRRTVSTYTAYA